MELQKRVEKALSDVHSSIVFSVERVTFVIKNTIADKAMDANYILTHLGGGNHRLLDGGHDIIGAWQMTGEVTSGSEHVKAWLAGLWNDLITPKGLPYVSMSPDQYENICKTLSFIPRNRIYDMLSYTPVELIGTVSAIPTVAVKTKKENIYSHTCIGTMLTMVAVRCHSIPAGILATVQIAKVARVIRKNKSARKEALEALTSTVIIGVLTCISPPLGIAVAIAYQLARTKIVRKKATELWKNLRSKIRRKPKERIIRKYEHLCRKYKL